MACNKISEECGHPCYGCLVHWNKSRTEDVGVSECGSRWEGNLLSLWMGGGKKKRIVIQREAIILHSLATTVKFMNGQHSIWRNSDGGWVMGWGGASGWRGLGRVTKRTHRCNFLTYLLTPWSTRWRSWLRHCATNRNVAGSIPDGFIGSFHWDSSSGRTMALGLTQPLREMSTGIFSGVKAAGA